MDLGASPVCIIYNTCQCNPPSKKRCAQSSNSSSLLATNIRSTTRYIWGEKIRNAKKKKGKPNEEEERRKYESRPERADPQDHSENKPSLKH